MSKSNLSLYNVNDEIASAAFGLDENNKPINIYSKEKISKIEIVLIKVKFIDNMTLEFKNADSSFTRINVESFTIKEFN